MKAEIKGNLKHIDCDDCGRDGWIHKWFRVKDSCCPHCRSLKIRQFPVRDETSTRPSRRGATAAGRRDAARSRGQGDYVTLMPNPAALALALLLGHEARITDEQWSEVKAMDDLCAICGIEPRNPLANVCQPCSDKVEQTRERLISERQTPPPCPACEAAARERDDLRARIAALCDYYDNMTGAADEKPLVMGDLVDELRALLAEKEAK